jgi:hypothetical protein
MSGSYPITSSDVTVSGQLFNEVSTRTLVVTAAAPELSASFSPSSVTVHQVSTLRLDLARTDENLTGAAGGLDYTLQLPLGATVVATADNTCGGTVTAVAGTRLITVSNASLGVGVSSCRLQVAVTSSLGDSYQLGNGAITSSDNIDVSFASGCNDSVPDDGAVVNSPACLPTLEVDKLLQTIAFAQPGDASPGTRQLSASASSQLAVAFSTETPSVCTVSGSTLTLASEGTCTINADQAGNGVYEAAQRVTRSLTVVAPPEAPATVTASAATSSIVVSWTASSGGSGVTGYRAIASPGPATCLTTSALTCVLGATAGVTYTVRVVALSATGDSTPSEASAEVTPTAPVPPSTPPPSDLTLTTDKGRITTAVPGQDVVFIGTGFAAYSTVTISIYSDPIVLGTVVTDGDGDFSKPVTIPAALALGGHTAVAQGIAPDGSPRSMNLAITVQAADGGAGGDALPVTGAGVATMLLVGLLLTGVGGGLLLTGRRRGPRGGLTV